MYRGKLWTMRQFSGFATPEETNQRYHYLLAQGQTGLSVAFDLPTLMGYDADHALSEGEVGKCGAPISSLEDMEILFRGIPLGDVSVSMTINSPASVMWAMYLAVAEQQGVPWDAAFRHAAKRHPEGIHRAEGVHLPAARFHAAGHRHDRIRRAAHAEIQSGFDQRLSHSRGGLDGRAGTGVHPARRHRVCGLGARARPRDRRFRAAPQLLLQRAQRFLRGDRQVPRGAQDLGARDARPLRGAERAQPQAALPRADGRMLADLAAAVQQRGAHRAAGHGRGAGRRAIAAHQFARRGLRAARGARRHDRAAHPAGAGLRERRRPTRPIRWAAATSWKSSRWRAKPRPTTTSGASTKWAA